MRLLLLLLFAGLLQPGDGAPPRSEPDVEYGKAGGVSLTLDASIPPGAGPFPAIVLVHGGGWRQGDKALNMRPVFQALSEAGFAWFSINYRLAPAHPYPAAVDDVAAAVRWVKRHARRYNLDASRLALCGESAGGHLVALAGARYGRQLGIGAVIPVYPPTDMDALAFGEDRTPSAVKAVTAFLGVSDRAAGAKTLREASPVSWVKRDMPPFLLIHGTADRTVPYAQSVKLQTRMRAAGARCDLFTVPDAPHGWGQWEKDPAMLAYRPYLIDWLKRTLKIAP